MSSADVAVQASETTTGDAVASYDSDTDDNQSDISTVEDLEAKKRIISSTPDKRRRVTRNMSKSNEPVDASSLCRNPQEFEFGDGARKTELKMSKIIYAEASSG